MLPLIIRGVTAIGAIFGVSLVLKRVDETVDTTGKHLSNLIVPATLVALVFLLRAWKGR